MEEAETEERGEKEKGNFSLFYAFNLSTNKKFSL